MAHLRGRSLALTSLAGWAFGMAMHTRSGTQLPRAGPGSQTNPVPAPPLSPICSPTIPSSWEIFRMISKGHLIQSTGIMVEAFNRKGNIDSLAVAVVTPAGTIFEHGYGVLKANDTSGKQYPVDKHSIYRIASISKMFAVFETLLLREEGALEFDDPVEKYIPKFKPPSADEGWPEYLRSRKGDSESQGYYGRASRITLRQLASHTAGLGRDFPVQNFTKWPIEATEFPEVPDGRNASEGAVLDGTTELPLINLPYGYPVYSNAGFDLLGLANVAANLKAKGILAKDEPKTYRDLVKRDIFDSFGLNSSFFRLPGDQDLKDHIAVPQAFPKWADADFGDADASAGGQYSSLSDLARIAQIFLSPKAPSKEHRFLPTLVREWLRPMHIWPNGNEAVGAPWEIVYLPPPNPLGSELFSGSMHLPEPSFPGHFEVSGRSTMSGYYQYPGRFPIYSKSGSLPGYQSLFSLNPEYGYAVIALATGKNPQPSSLVFDIFNKLQPFFARSLLDRVVEAYVGTWEGEGGGGREDKAEVAIIAGQLFLRSLIVNGVDVLKSVREAVGTHTPQLGTQPVALWSTGRPHEFRMSPGNVHTGGVESPSCINYWATIGYPGVFARGASVGLIYWEDGELAYPSAGVRLKRKTRCGLH
uniref:Beta-lactamase class C binding protein-like protein n=1 Tax=Coprinellus disseminatus TaxID=71703 RepID=Q1WMR8_COPDI|nr:beta-lactamase class C binding protein-like protein [Coprinellus disseminatus]